MVDTHPTPTLTPTLSMGLSPIMHSRYAALKIVKSAPNYTVAAEDEVKLLRSVQTNDQASPGAGHVVLLYDDFVVRFVVSCSSRVLSS
jgi:hypothetical protein